MQIFSLHWMMPNISFIMSVNPEVVVTFDETNISGCLHLSMQNIEMTCNIDRPSRWSNVNISK